MSAVAIALSTPIYAMADTKASVLFRGIPPGDYKLYVWIKGVLKFFLDSLSRPVHLSDRKVNQLGIRHDLLSRITGSCSLCGSPKG
jgi:hypothetical protein